jgi:Iron-containing redox enzyme
MDSYAGLRDRDFFHIMLNLDSHEDFLPTARTLAEAFLDAARTKLTDGTLEPELRAFPYSMEAFTTRLDEIYQGLADDVRRYEAQRGWTRRTRADVIEWMLQMAPFNQTDGAWLRTIAPVGPMNEVEALLFSIYSDEIGAGDPERNHANMYTELLHSVDIDLPDIRSRDYAEHPEIVDAAYTSPCSSWSSRNSHRTTSPSCWA